MNQPLFVTIPNENWQFIAIMQNAKGRENSAIVSAAFFSS
jgi:hypothetical protein